MYTPVYIDIYSRPCASCLGSASTAASAALPMPAAGAGMPGNPVCNAVYVK